MNLQIIQNKLAQDVFSNLEIVNCFKDLLLMFNNVIVHCPYETVQNANW